MRERFEEGEARFQRELYINRNILIDDDYKDKKYISNNLIEKILILLKIKKKFKK